MRQGQHRLILRRTLTLMAATVTLATFALPVCAQSSLRRLPKLAGGVMQTIPSEPNEADTVTGPRAFAALAKSLPEWEPNYLADTDTLLSMSNSTTFRRTIWQLEFNFKPVRMIKTSDGRLVWYMVYKVRNIGGHIVPSEVEDDSGNSVLTLEKGDYPVRFYPVFTLEGHDYQKRYTDRIVPGLIEQIHAKEIRDPRTKLYSSVHIGDRRLDLSTDEIDRGVWGVAMWENVDARTDFFSVFVGGLTNAYQWSDNSPPGKNLKYKTLQLNFWRPGDTYRESEDQIRYGMPKVTDLAKKAKLLNIYSLDEAADHRWVYR